MIGKCQFGCCMPPMLLQQLEEACCSQWHKLMPAGSSSGLVCTVQRLASCQMQGSCACLESRHTSDACFNAIPGQSSAMQSSSSLAALLPGLLHCRGTWPSQHLADPSLCFGLILRPTAGFAFLGWPRSDRKPCLHHTCRAIGSLWLKCTCAMCLQVARHSKVGA